MLMAMPSARSDRRPRGHAALPDWYRSLLAEHSASGLSLAEFAEVAAVSATSLSRWRSRLGRADCAAPRDHRLVEVRVAERDPGRRDPAAASFTIRLTDERRIEVGHGFGAGELRRLILAIEAC